jgi:hypothetical protein
MRAWEKAARGGHCTPGGAKVEPTIRSLAITSAVAAICRDRQRPVLQGLKYATQCPCTSRGLASAARPSTGLRRSDDQWTRVRYRLSRDRESSRRWFHAVAAVRLNTEWSCSTPQRKECLERASFPPPTRPVGTFFCVIRRRPECRRMRAFAVICPNHEHRPGSPFWAVFRFSPAPFSDTTEPRPFWYGCEKPARSMGYAVPVGRRVRKCCAQAK